MAGAQIKLDRRLTKSAKGIFEKYEFQVGVLADKPHRDARRGGALKNYAGGPARRTGKSSGLMVSDVSERLRKQTGINFYTRPFAKSVKSRDIQRFAKSFFELCTGRTQKRRCETLLQAIVRNPILRGDYGTNSPKTAKIKGFNRFMIDTAQLFKAITARVTQVSRKK